MCFTVKFMNNLTVITVLIIVKLNFWPIERKRPNFSNKLELKYFGNKTKNLGGLLQLASSLYNNLLQLVAVNEEVLISSSLDQSVSVWSVSDGRFKHHMR